MKNCSYRRIQLKQAAEMRRRRRENRVKKMLRIRRALRPRNKRQRYRSNPQDPYKRIILPTISFEAPSDFSLLRTPENVIAFINNVNRTVRKSNFKCQVSVDLANVIETDNEAIGLLLTLVNALARHNVRSFGNLPKDDNAYNIFISSGFLDRVKSLQGMRGETKDTFIVQRGFSQPETELVSREVKKIMSYLTGEWNKYSPLYTLINEVIFNSIEHANQRDSDKNWILAVHYAENHVRLMIADIGKGIMDTLRKRMAQSVRDTVTLKNEVDVLYDLFDRKYQSSTFEENRNQGLPKIKELYDKRYISNLCVITNKVMLDFNGINSRVLTNNLQGTFYSLELNNENITTWKQRTI